MAVAFTLASNWPLVMSSLGGNLICPSGCSKKWLLLPGFVNSRESSLGVSLKILDAKRVRIFGPRARLCGKINALSKGESAAGGILEKEFEFTPTFDEYLKAMETVKLVREKAVENKVPRVEKKVSQQEIAELRNDGRCSQGQNAARVMEKDDSLRSTKESTSHQGVKAGNRDKERERNYVKVWERKQRSNEKGEGNAVKSIEVRGKLGKKHRTPVERVNCERNVQENMNLRTNNKALVDLDNDIGDIERAAFKNFEEFSEIVDKPRVSKMEMEERIQKLAKQLNGADINMPEWMFSKMMRAARIRFSDHSILRVIQILGKYGNWKRVLQVIEWLRTRERFKSHKLRYIYTAALDVLKKTERPVEALNLFYAMQQQMVSYPDLVAYHCIAVTLGRAGHMKELFDVIDSMRSPPKKKFKIGPLEKWDPRLEPDIVVYNAVLNACALRKQWEGAFWVLQQLNQQGLQPSAATYGLVMEVMFTCGKYNLVHDFFRKVQKSSIPNALTYKVLVNTLSKEGRTDEALLAVKDMESRGIVGSSALYYDLARCLCSAGRCQEALMQIEKICKVANKPLVVTYTGLIQACLESGNIKDAAYIFNQMHKFCLPNLVTCNIMMKGYLDHGMFEEAKDLFKIMLKDGTCISSGSDYKVRVLPDIYTFNTMLEACAAEKRWDDFTYTYERMLHHGFHFNAKRHLRMIIDASRAGKEELVETTWKHLAHEDRIPPPSLVKERFCMKLEKGDYAAALSCITSHPTRELPDFSKKAWSNLFKENATRFRSNTLAQLIYEVGNIIAKTDLPNPVYLNLLTSCREFFRTIAV